MKKVVSPENVAHLFANKIQSEARTSTNNLYFNNSYNDNYIIYSYSSHFPIAKHVTNENGLKALLFTTRGYSVSTSKHIRIVSSACNHLNTIYCNNPNENTQYNIDEFVSEAENIVANLLKAKKPEKYLNELSYVQSKVNKYLSFFGLKLENYPKLAAVLNISNKSDYLQYSEKKTELAKSEETKRQNELKKQLSKELTKWRSGKVNRLYFRNGYDFLRLSSDGTRVQTSQNIEIPLNKAKVFYSLVLKSISKGGCTDCDLKILDYQVTEINKDFIKIGCHTIETKEYKKLAKKLGW